MTIKCRPVFSLLLAATFCLPPAFCQGLPPTNMGKFVHQPGDNQYKPESQFLRHGDAPGNYLDNTGCIDNRPAIQQRQVMLSTPATPVYVFAPPPPRGPDISIERIVAEEPVPPEGFPPLPVALDLPVPIPNGNMKRGSWKNHSSGGGGGGGGGGGQYEGEFEHYKHFSPGAFAPKKNNSGGDDDGGGGGGDEEGGYQPAPTPTAVTSQAVPAGNSLPPSNYYKCRTPPPIVRTDTYSTTTPGGTHKGATTAPTMVGVRNSGGKGGASGKAPGLDDSQDAAAGAPELPTTTGVFQAQSEDLTLPDDEYTSRYFKDSAAGRKVKQYVKQGASFGRNMLRNTGIPIGF